MRIKIEHVETRTGFPFKRVAHEVHLTADFSHEEKQIIRQRGLGDQLLLERWPADARESDDPAWYGLKVRHLLERRPDRFRCAHPSEAKAYEARLLEVLQGLKLWLEENAEPAGITVVEI